MKKETKPVPFSTVVLYGVTAIIWILNVAVDFLYRTPDLLTALRVLTAVVWCVSFGVWLVRYRKQNHSP